MQLYLAQQLAKNLMLKHNLTSWTFVFDNSVRRFGQCCYTARTIKLSKHLTALNDEATVKDTILHEIAHALTPGAHHGWAWKRKCIEIGAKPERCYTSENTVTPKLRYVAECQGCGKEIERQKKPNTGSNWSCKCQSGIPWSLRKLLTFKQR